MLVVAKSQLQHLEHDKEGERDKFLVICANVVCSHVLSRRSSFFFIYLFFFTVVHTSVITTFQFSF